MTQPLQRCPAPAQQGCEGSAYRWQRDDRCAGDGRGPVAITLYMSLMACPEWSSMPSRPGIPQWCCVIHAKPAVPVKVPQRQVRAWTLIR